MNKKNIPPLGVIEGFFGRQWSWADRTAYANFFALHGLNFYIYAPKGDTFLRKHWQQDWPLDVKQELTQLRHIYRTANIQFGVGLSPHEIYLDNTRDNRHALTQRVKQINSLEPDILCLLFDDMRGDLPDLANIQIDLMHQVAETSNAQQIIFCPTYYSFDPVLEKVFGKMPENYWHDLNRKLDKKIDIFWTGEKVCSESYSSKHISDVTDLLGRKPFLWDNYPVNDGAVKSNHLHIRPVHQTHSQLQHSLAGHALNPMNQAQLSKIALASLAQAYELGDQYNTENSLQALCTEICSAELSLLLIQDIPLLQDKGLKHITENEKVELKNRYSALVPNPFCEEIIDWLDGGYEFDPACLTE